MLTNWDGLAPAVAAVSLGLLAFLPSKPDGVSTLAVREVRQAALESGPAGSAVAWADRGSGLAGTLTPSDVFRDAEGRMCRTYTVVVAGTNDSSLHSACRLPSGVWQSDDAGQTDHGEGRGVIARLFHDEAAPQTAELPGY